MAPPPFLPQDLAADDAMTDIGFGAEALDARGIATEDADIMQHRSLFEELHVEFQLRVLLRYQQTAISHLPAMH
jgi:hypothetical protein